MNPTVTFYIARHGKTLMNTFEKVQGWCDSPLTPEGITDAECLGAGLRDITFSSAYCSDLRRTRQTAEILLSKHGQTGLTVTEKKGFREVCFGSYEASSNYKMWNDAAMYLHYSRLEFMYDALNEKKITHKDIVGAINELETSGLSESFEQVESRMQDTLTKIAEKETIKGKDSNVLVVSHGLCIAIMLHNLGGKNMPKLYIDNATVCKVKYNNGKFTVETMGDDSYLTKGRKELYPQP